MMTRSTLDERQTPEAEPYLVIEGLTIKYGSALEAVSGVDLSIRSGEILGLIGESGCGKSSVALAAMNLLPRAATTTTSRFEIVGKDVRDVGETAWNKIRGRDASIVFQEPMTALNPCMRVGHQISEVLLLHKLVQSKPAAEEAALGLLNAVQLTEPELRMKQFPHQLSGGMRQRVMIAIAMAGSARLLVADEPTTALDVTVQAQILELIRDLRDERGLAVLFVSHDLGVITGICDRVVVMYAGQIVEEGRSWDVLSSPRHPYTAGLIGCIPVPGANPGEVLPTIPGRVSQTDRTTVGCRFRSRCSFAIEKCAEPQELRTTEGKDRAVRCWRSEELGLEGVRVQSEDQHG